MTAVDRPEVAVVGVQLAPAAQGLLARRRHQHRRALHLDERRELVVADGPDLVYGLWDSKAAPGRRSPRLIINFNCRPADR